MACFMVRPPDRIVLMSKSLAQQDTYGSRDVKEDSMAKQGSAGRQELYERITDAVRAYQRSVDLRDEIACVIMGITRPDGRCLDLLHNNGPMTAGRLATESGLTTGGVTAVIDRLEKGGWA